MGNSGISGFCLAVALGMVAFSQQPVKATPLRGGCLGGFRRFFTSGSENLGISDLAA